MTRRLLVACFMRAAFPVAATLWLLAIHMVLLASAPPVERHISLHAGNWPAGAPPMRIVLLSDLHVSIPGDSPRRLAETVARVNATRPDLIVIAGDFLSTETHFVWSADIAQATAPLADLHARLGVVGVLGNHDYDHPRELRMVLASHGVALLEDRAMKRGPVTLLGFADYHSPHTRGQDIFHQFRTLGGWPIVVSHTPDVVPHLPRFLPLTLAGHIHCGQVHLPFIRLPAGVTRYGNRYRCGMVREPGRITLVTGGLGVSQLPLRFDAPPDYWVIDIGR